MSKVTTIQGRPVEPWVPEMIDSCVLMVTTWVFLSTWANCDTFSKAPGTFILEVRVFHQVMLAGLQLSFIHVKAELDGYTV